jgi:hypothetical protein
VSNLAAQDENQYVQDAPHPSCERYWVEIGARMWERIELELHRVSVPFRQADYWMSVREFERDLTSWARVWRDREFYHPMRNIHVRMSSLMDLLLSALRTVSGSVEVCARDENQHAVTVLIRLKGRPQEFHAVAVIPMRSSVQWL